MNDRRKPRMAGRRGFTLIELMVTIAVLAILLGIAVPSFNDAVLGSKLTSLANDFVGSATLARSEAIKRNAVVTLCVSADGAGCTEGGWEQGWIVVSGTTVIQHRQALPSGMKISAEGALGSLAFQPTGVGSTQAKLTVCRAAPTVGGEEREISISATGRPSVVKTANASCS